MNIDEIIASPEIQKIEAGVSGCRIEVKKWMAGKSIRDVLNDIQSCQELFADCEYHVYLPARHYQYIKSSIDFIKTETRCVKFITSEKTAGVGIGDSDCVLFVPADVQDYSNVVMLYGV